MTAAEIRERILTVVASNGGHLASSLGAVELSLALVQVFDPFRDRIVWDVGHQAYAWKILTGREQAFATLRKLDGLSGFPNPAESPADAAVAGHAGVALSVALGLAAARDQRGSQEHVVAVVGDGAMANGVCLEALNHCAAATKKVIVVLNDNEMSISRPTGSFARMLGRLITGVRYNRVKKAAESAGHALRLTFLRGVYHRLESRLKSIFLGNAFFEQFGLRYIGPVDGHDVKVLESAFRVAKADKRSVLVHVVTKKGCGYAPAEHNPTTWHGVGPFGWPTMVAKKVAAKEALSWSSCFGAALCDLARNDVRVCAMTAAMKDGTGLETFARLFPSRFFDVGIAEEHLTAFAAGLAAGGQRPVVAIYSTFFQRAIDQVMHDVALSKLPVVFCVDRAGVVGADGRTHQGVFDLAMLRCLPNLSLLQPCNAAELRAMLSLAIERGVPTVIRYPRGVPDAGLSQLELPPLEWGRACELSSGRDLVLWALGDQVAKSLQIAAILKAKGFSVGVVYARFIKPFDAALLARQREEGVRIASLENGCLAGGFGEAIGAQWRFGWPDEFVPQGTVAELEARYHFDAASIAQVLEQRLKR